MQQIFPGEVFADTRHFDNGMRQLLPQYDEMLDTIVNCLPSNCGRILELGCGTGELSLKILKKYPDIEITALDYSPRMIQFASRKVAEAGYQERWEGLEIDFGNWANNPETVGIKHKFDACVSSLAIHHLNSEMKLKLVKQIYQSLNSQGCFWNADPVLPESPLLKEAYDFAKAKRSDRSGEDLSKVRSQLAVNDQSVSYCENYGHSSQDQLVTLDTHLQVLSAAGFSIIAVPWKYYGLAVFGGWVSSQESEC